MDPLRVHAKVAHPYAADRTHIHEAAPRPVGPDADDHLVFEPDVGGVGRRLEPPFFGRDGADPFGRSRFDVEGGVA